ncbi:hypothetical protein ACTZFV_23410, partial [Escherichia coli]
IQASQLVVKIGVAKTGVTIDSVFQADPYKGLLKNDNQLAMLFTLANLFRVDQMIRQWERSQ